LTIALGNLELIDTDSICPDTQALIIVSQAFQSLVEILGHREWLTMR